MKIKSYAASNTQMVVEKSLTNFFYEIIKNVFTEHNFLQIFLILEILQQTKEKSTQKNHSAQKRRMGSQTRIQNSFQGVPKKSTLKFLSDVLYSTRFL